MKNESILKLIDLAKHTALEAGRKISSKSNELKEIQSVILSGKETKIKADEIMEDLIIRCLEKTGIPILSEESGYINVNNNSNYVWIIDPLDGSLNFSRNSGPSAISIALWEDNNPVFGVIYLIDEHSIAWGGQQFGSWLNDIPITTSTIYNNNNAVLCTGIPSRFDKENKETMNYFNQLIFNFSKVRMYGSAACSMVKVATGSAEAYWEEDIMIWDVAAGIPIVIGATGIVKYTNTHKKFQYSVKAANKVIFENVF